MTYDEAYPYRHLIKLMTQAREMPPWKPADGCGDFEGTRRLSQRDIDIIAQWVDSGSPEGRSEDLPAPLEFKNGWTNGEPDIVLTMPQPYSPPPLQEMYRCFSIPVENAEQKFVQTVDVRPGDRATVHHVIGFIDATGVSESLDAQEEGPGYKCFGGPGFLPTGMLAAWAPGTRPSSLPDGVGISLPENARVVLQVHYHVHDNSPHSDQTSVGIYFSDKPVEKTLHVLPLWNDNFTIPAGAKDYMVRAEQTVPVLFPIHAYLVGPHMHLLGKRMKVEAVLPSGQRVCLIDIPDWDFNWQGSYHFKTPIALPGLTRLEMTAWYDNSDDNPRNPNSPPKPVSWGEATTDEMALAFIGFTLD
jgi:hypothetical protein